MVRSLAYSILMLLLSTICVAQTAVPRLKLPVVFYIEEGSLWLQKREVMGDMVNVLDRVYAQGNIEIQIKVRPLKPVSPIRATDLESWKRHLDIATFDTTSLNVFFVNHFDAGVTDNVQGMSEGIPGRSYCNPKCITGVYMGANNQNLYQRNMTAGFTLAHEIGHFLGLYHTQTAGKEFGEIQAWPQGGPRSENVMDSGDKRNAMFTASQFQIMRSHVLFRNQFRNYSRIYNPKTARVSCSALFNR